MRDRRFDLRQEFLDDQVTLEWSDPTGAPSQCTGTLCDLSVSGVRIKVEHPIRLQTSVGLTVRGKELRGKVQYCTHAQTNFMLGVAFGMDSRGVLKPSL